MPEIKTRKVKVLVYQDEKGEEHYLALDAQTKRPLEGVVMVHTYEDGDGKLVAEVGLYTTDVEVLKKA